MQTLQSEVSWTNCFADNCNRLGGTVPGSGSCVQFVRHPRCKSQRSYREEVCDLLQVMKRKGCSE